MSAVEKSMRSVVLGALWTVPDCPDSSEVERACRSCEAGVVAEAVLTHLLKVEEEILAEPFIWEQMVLERQDAAVAVDRQRWWRFWG